MQRQEQVPSYAIEDLYMRFAKRCRRVPSVFFCYLIQTHATKSGNWKNNCKFAEFDLKSCSKIFNSLTPKISFNNSPYCLPNSSCNVSLENLVLDQLIIPWLIFFFILITFLLVIVLILKGEILSWSLVGVKGLRITLLSGRSDLKEELCP